MATQEKDRTCAGLVQKITAGTPLDDADKAHLAACEECMAQTVRTLDEAARQNCAGGAANGHAPCECAEAARALEHGRQVFEREFGIKL